MKDYKLKSGNILRVIQDENSESPDNWGDEDIFLVYDHRQFTVKREGFEPKDIFEYFENCHEQIENDRFDDYFIFPVDAYIHSDIHLSLTNTKNHPDSKWDVSTTGYVLVNKEYVDVNGYPSKHKTPEDFAKTIAEGLIETWNQYLSGDIWGFQVLKLTNYFKIEDEDLIYIRDNSNDVYNSIVSKGELVKEYKEIDSCWGFYGSDPKENGMLEDINDELIN